MVAIYISLAFVKHPHGNNDRTKQFFYFLMLECCYYDGAVGKLETRIPA